MSKLSKKLTLPPKDLVSVYQAKWKNIALAVNSQNSDRLERTIALIYNLIGLEKPQVLFFDSPYSALKTLATISSHQLGNGVKHRIKNKSIAVLQGMLEEQINGELFSHIESDCNYNNVEKLEFLVWERLHQELKLNLGKKQWLKLDEK